MRTMLSKVTLGFVCLATAGWTASGAPLKRADVAADPAWVVHLDCDGLRPTTIGQHIQTEMNKPDAQDKLAAFESMFGFDLRTQLHGLTLYGTGSNPHDGVLLVYADFDPDRLVTLANAAKDAQNSSYKQHVIYNWVDEKRKAKDGVQPRVYAAIAGKRVVFGQREDRVARALDVLDGAASNLAAAKAFPQLGAPGDTSFAEAAARKIEVADGDPHAAILRLSRQIRLQLAETKGQVVATLTLEANDSEVASNISSIAQGLVSLMKLQKEKPEAMKVAEALTLKQDGSAVIVSLVLPAQDAVGVIQAHVHAAHKAAKEAEKD
ncbi:MAG TPA: hypothetical protein VNZ64_16820 [Candidatus Acidoferrum sp.]|jgi:hypothetical protein|nr:hypothetical protein [Candidatus Acidoferrum sp.]